MNDRVLVTILFSVKGARSEDVMTVNKVILVGNLGADPESRSTQSGSTLAKLRIATTERAKDRDGNWGEHTEWHRVTCFGRTAENVAKFCRKGKQVYIEGKIRTSKYQDRDGNDRWSTEVIADQVRFLGGRGDSSGSYDSAPSNPAPSGGYGGGADIDDDIPF